MTGDLLTKMSLEGCKRREKSLKWLLKSKILTRMEVSGRKRNRLLKKRWII
jgi:hypothetical protein